MARANFVKKARKPIYVQGRRVSYQGTKGTKREGKVITKIDRTMPADQKDKVLINIGESYWWWQFKNSPVTYSRTKPRRSQLTHSEFLSWLYDLEDTIGEFSVGEEELENYESSDLEAVRDEWVDQINTEKDELDERLNNMPEGLRENSSSGQLLQERIDALEAWVYEFENVDLDWDNEDLETQAKEEWEALKAKDMTDGLGDEEDWLKDRLLELKREKIEELIADLQAIQCEAG